MNKWVFTEAAKDELDYECSECGCEEYPSIQKREDTRNPLADHRIEYLCVECGNRGSSLVWDKDIKHPNPDTPVKTLPDQREMETEYSDLDVEFLIKSAKISDRKARKSRECGNPERYAMERWIAFHSRKDAREAIKSGENDE